VLLNDTLFCAIEFLSTKAVDYARCEESCRDTVQGHDDLFKTKHSRNVVGITQHTAKQTSIDAVRQLLIFVLLRDVST